MTAALPRRGEWLDRAFVLVGRGATGLLPVVMLGFASRSLGLQAMGNFATAIAVALGLADIADFISERHVPRAVFADGSTRERDERLGAFNGLRLITLSIFGLSGFVLLAKTTDRGALAANTAILLVSVFVLLTKTLYASALAERRFLLVGAGPLLSLAVATISCAILLRSPYRSLWAIAISLHLAKLGETVFLALYLAMPKFHFHRRGLGEEWRQTRYLLLQGLFSAANARLIVPIVAAISGTVFAGLLSIGVSFLSVTSLMAIAITVPAYRYALEAGALREPLDVFRRMKRDWLSAVTLSVVLTVSLCAISGPLLNAMFHIESRDAHIAIVLIILSGTFETLSLFAGTYYHASFNDRRLFIVSVANMIGGWILIGIGLKAGSVIGMGWGFFFARALGALALYTPILASRFKRPGADAVATI